MLGPVLERLHNELLDPMIDMTFTRMVEAGIIPPPPQELQGMELSVEFVSMLAQAQRAIGTNSVDRYVANLGAVAQFKPDVLDKFDSDQWADVYGDMLGVDPKLIVASDKVAVIRDSRAKMQAQQAQMEQIKQMSEVGRNLGTVQTGDGTNAGMDLINQFSGYGSPSPSQV
jgi:hypothetical protein